MISTAWIVLISWGIISVILVWKNTKPLLAFIEEMRDAFGYDIPKALSLGVSTGFIAGTLVGLVSAYALLITFSFGVSILTGLIVGVYCGLYFNPFFTTSFGIVSALSIWAVGDILGKFSVFHVSIPGGIVGTVVLGMIGIAVYLIHKELGRKEEVKKKAKKKK